MFTTAIMLGFCSAIGVFVILLRLPRMLILRTLGYAWALDVFFTFLLFAMHWGTAVGGFSAVIGGLFCSLGITIAKCCLGHISPKGTYIKGWFGDTRPTNRRGSTAQSEPLV